MQAPVAVRFQFTPNPTTPHRKTPRGDNPFVEIDSEDAFSTDEEDFREVKITARKTTKKIKLSPV